FYPYLEPMYYRMMDLVRVIHSRRALSGDSLPDIPYPGTTKVRVPNEEWARCKAIARPIWRLIVERTHPEWFEDLDTFFVHGYIGGWGSYYEYKERTKRRGIVSHAILSDPLVMSFYQEAVATGINGIGPMGREDLRLLLIEENPELMEGNEIPSH
ncbi:MAG TPA: hypothetical protein P5247_00725, partial [Candidatus Saccharimonadales bacterium]|nr:hypothetical protein [Candidatus Saccharimonadales bacterium]